MRADWGLATRSYRDASQQVGRAVLQAVGRREKAGAAAGQTQVGVARAYDVTRL